ncbi:hypothetical protein [Mycolicibacter senuensis]|uniref:Uncharacterized protein n=1 Tax=Mycolicibacter senuensis TaxID=386913 RepID=A0A7I9XL79_9MYCO|nr:hypothetical protein [Mycolicibacter senuensis]ORW63833.1 hypothetical protein AWC24_02165 [Mycolicibacter senuensis]GFG70310.1 hypothetical protein MSEN_20300 [Mycolicibacter senuensis]
MSTSDTGGWGCPQRPTGPPSEPNQWAGKDRRRLRRAAQRVCVLTRHHLRQHDIAAALGVSRPALAQIVGRVPLPQTPMPPAERRKCLAALWPFPVEGGLTETYWYSVDPVVEQVRSSIEFGGERAVRLLAGGEVAAEVLRPFLLPTRGLVYATQLIDLAACGLVEVSAEEATLTVRVPADPTVWATASWWNRVTDGEHACVSMVDPVVVLEDLAAGTVSGGVARERLIEWIADR